MKQRLAALAASLWYEPSVAAVLVVWWWITGLFTTPVGWWLCPACLALLAVTFGLKVQRRRVEHRHCVPEMGAHMRAAGFEVHVTEVPPLVDSPNVTSATCPHGRRLYVEATGEQVAAWAAAERQRGD